MSKKADKIHKKKVAFLKEALGRMDDAAIKWQSDLLELLLTEYFPLFDVKDGVILDTAHNDTLINKIDTFIDKLQKALQRDILGTFAADLLKSSSFSADYYRALGFKKTVVDNVLKKKIHIERKLGFTPTGRLKKKGYLYRLGQAEEVRQKLKQYVIDSLLGDTDFLSFQLGFRNLVKGNKRKKGLATNGALQKYFDQYAYDSFNMLDASTNKQFADNLGLKHFIYEGSLIATSRPFCRKRAGKAFTVAETKTWKDDPDLIDKANKDTYKPLIERGRYRCRHFIKYVTKVVYLALTKKAA